MRGLIFNNSIRSKLVTACVILTMVPMVILESIFLVQFKNYFYNREIENAQSFTDRLIYDYSIEMEKAESIANDLAEFTPLSIYLHSQYQTTSAALSYYKLNVRPMLTGFDAKSNLRIRIYHRTPIINDSIIMANSLSEFAEQYFDADPFVKNTAFWMHLDCCSFHPVMSYFRVVLDNTFSNPDYVIAVHMKENTFYSYIANESPEERIIIVTDNDGNILTSNIPAGFTFREENYSIVEKSNGTVNVRVLVSPEKLKEQFRSTALFIIATGIALICLSMLLVSIITKRLTGGMSELISKMKSVDQSSIHIMAADTADDTSSDEICQLDAAFTKMMQQIDILLDKIRNDERQLKDEIITRQQVELRSLQQQINPHYLFNTLESIRMNLVMKNDYENANIVKLFAESFRRYMNMNQKYSSLYEEMLFIDKYISIQNYRLDNKIRYKLDAQDFVMKYKVLRLIIQPIVENSVIHGIESRSDGGNITVKIDKEQNRLFIIVSDDGDGMSVEELSDLKNSICDDQTERSIGLKNVYKRIKLAYGDTADLKITSKKGVGTEVTLILPIITNEMENE